MGWSGLSAGVLRLLDQLRFLTRGGSTTSAVKTAASFGVSLIQAVRSPGLPGGCVRAPGVPLLLEMRRRCCCGSYCCSTSFGRGGFPRVVRSLVHPVVGPFARPATESFTRSCLPLRNCPSGRACTSRPERLRDSLARHRLARSAGGRRLLLLAEDGDQAVGLHLEDGHEIVVGVPLLSGLRRHRLTLGITSKSFAKSFSDRSSQLVAVTIDLVGHVDLVQDKDLSPSLPHEVLRESIRVQGFSKLDHFLDGTNKVV